MASNSVKILIETLYKGGGLKQAADDIKGFGRGGVDSVNKLGGAMAGLEIAAIGVGYAIKQAVDFGGQGAQLTRLGDSFQSLASVASVSGDELLAALDKAAQGSIANSDLILATNRAMMLGLGADAEKLSQLMQIAAFRGRAMGLTTTQAFNDIVTGVGRASPQILDNLGIITDAETTYKAYAESIGKSSDELTKAEQTQALMNKVLEDGNRQIAAAGGVVDDTAASYERWNASLKDTFQEFQKGTGEIMEPAIRTTGNWIEALGDAIAAENKLNAAVKDGTITQWEANAQINKMTWTSYTAADAQEWLAAKTKDAQGAEEDMIDTRRESIESMREHRIGIEENTEALKEQSDQYKTMLSNMFKVQDAEEDFVKDEERRAEKMRDIQADQTRLAIELGDLRAEGKADFEKENEYALKQIELQEKYNELLEESEDAIKDKERATKELVYRQLEQKAAQDGIIDTDELRFLQDTAVSMGLVDRASADMSIQAAETADVMWAEFQKPEEAVGDIQARLDALVNGSPYTAEVRIEQVGNVPTIGGATTSFLNSIGVSGGGLSNMPGFAEGGSFVVPGSGIGDRPYMIGLTPGEHVQVTPKGEAPGMTVNLYVTGVIDRNMVNYLKEEITRLQVNQ